MNSKLRDWAQSAGWDPRRVFNGRRVWARPSSTITFGLRYDVDQLVTRVVRNRGVFEPATTAFFIANVSPGDVAVDVGANVGYFTILLSSLVGAAGHVHAYEPAFAAALRRNLEVNSNSDTTLANVTVHPCALSNVTGEAPLYFPSHGHHAYGSLRRPSSHGRRFRERRVICRRLDDEPASSGRVEWMKLDVEGAEGLVLDGARETLTRYRPHVVTEWNGPALEESGISERALFEFLAGLGYQLFVSSAGMGPLELPTAPADTHTVLATAHPEALRRWFTWA